MINRIILVGNGFDLAHGLKTSYADFINWYWKQWGEKLLHSSNRNETDGLCSFTLKDNEIPDWYLLPSWRYKMGFRTDIDQAQVFIDTLKADRDVCDLKFDSLFFEEICQSIETKGWVDIECEYYKMLISQYKGKADALNKELDILKTKLAEYLRTMDVSKIEDNHIKASVQSRFLYPLKYNDISIDQLSIWKDFFNERLKWNEDHWYQLLLGYRLKNNEERLYYISRYVEICTEKNDEDIYDSSNSYDCPAEFLLPSRTMLLNFNYTQTADLYIPSQGTAFCINHIHGKLDKNDSVIFGYGDEISEKFREILEMDDNEQLKNMKSIRYLESRNYRDMLNFIESAPFQILIMGHSCGKSDRTLLNTLFEHPNCISIKPFYWQKEDGSDNYLETAQNICRNFTDTKRMRSEVVNKEFCEPMVPIAKQR